MSMQLWNDPFYYRRSPLVDPRFGGWGIEPEDVLAPIVPREVYDLLSYPQRLLQSVNNENPLSEVTFDKDRFQVNMDVQHFKPEEITVKVTGDNTITVEGKHEEKRDEHGYISRHFVRKYVLPKDHDINRLESKLSSDGVLTLTAPKVQEEALKEREIPIIRSGKPSKPIVNKSGKK